MFQISKEQNDYIRKNIKNPYIVICSKGKRGSKGNKLSGKTYFCPESRRYTNLLDEFAESGGDANAS